MTVYSYLRVSTDRRAEEDESLGEQQRQVEGYAMMKERTVDHHVVERGVSGSVPLADRPKGSKLLSKLVRGDVIITPKLDRMFRSSLDALAVLKDLKDRGVSLHMIDLGGDVIDNGISKLVFTILSAVAEAERDRIKERIGLVKADQKKRGRYLGGTVPFGYQAVPSADGGKGSDLVEVPEQIEAIARMRALKASGQSLRTISAALKAEGVNVSHMAIKEILERDGAPQV